MSVLPEFSEMISLNRQFVCVKTPINWVTRWNYDNFKEQLKFPNILNTQLSLLSKVTIIIMKSKLENIAQGARLSLVYFVICKTHKIKQLILHLNGKKNETETVILLLFSTMEFEKFHNKFSSSPVFITHKKILIRVK